MKNFIKKQKQEEQAKNITLRNLNWTGHVLRIENTRKCTTEMASMRKEYSRLIKYNVEETYRANHYSWPRRHQHFQITQLSPQFKSLKEKCIDLRSKLL